jgi:hypothetical protein
MQSLSMANVPWFYCKKDGCYRVRSGFRFPGVEGKPARNSALTAAALRCVIDDLRKDLTRTVETLTRYSDQLAEDCDTT